MSYSQKYCIVSLKDSLVVGTKFSMDDWPVHITLADVFAVELTDTIMNDLISLAGDTTPIEIIGKCDALLGETKVVLLDRNPLLLDFHHKLIGVLEEHGATFNTPEYTKEGFVAHSTVQKNGRLQLHEIVKVSSYSLVDMFPDNNWKQRKILRNFKFQQL
jgi:hypothetical protein